MEPMSRLPTVQIEWQENVSKRDIHANKTHQSTYRVKGIREGSVDGVLAKKMAIVAACGAVISQGRVSEAHG